jgi:hypothetical protein
LNTVLYCALRTEGGTISDAQDDVFYRSHGACDAKESYTETFRSITKKAQ